VTRVIFVGTSDAFGTGGRRQSAYLIEGRTGRILLDCAPTTLTGFEDLGIARDSIDVICVSHFHGDHFGGVPQFLLAARFVDRRARPLHVMGPRGLEERVRGVATALGHPFADGSLGFPLRFHEFGADRELDVGPFHVEAFPTHHAPDSMPHGLIVSTGAHRIAYSGDTGWFDGLPRAVGRSDLFICECTQEVSRWEYHLAYEELHARHAEFDCDRIVLTHLGPDMRKRDTAEPFELADDGMIIDLGK
jgi:ribonuclease BN (tRNA processing enzyme)